jgi:hypothetical protein
MRYGYADEEVQFQRSDVGDKQIGKHCEESCCEDKRLGGKE